jgi:hypothetical protein
MKNTAGSLATHFAFTTPGFRYDEECFRAVFDELVVGMKDEGQQRTKGEDESQGPEAVLAHERNLPFLAPIVKISILDRLENRP